MSEKVCYIAKDATPTEHTYNVYPECIKEHALGKLHSDHSVDPVPDGQIVVAIINNIVYQTEIEPLGKGIWSQCYGPDGARASAHFYVTTDEVLTKCISNNQVCYITKDDVGSNFANGVEPKYTYNLEPNCVKDNALRKLNSDSFTDAVPSEQLVIAINSYNDNILYQTEIETLGEGEHSQCSAPDDVRSITSYYVVQDDVLTKCILHDHVDL